MEILATLHPDNSPNDDLFPNVKKENIPSKAINLSKLSPEVQAKLPKVINTVEVLPATKLKYLEIDGNTYYIPQRVDITSNIKITGSKNDILSSPHNLLCLLNNTSSLAIKVVDKIVGGSEEISTLSTVLPQGIYYACSARYNDNIYIFGGYNGNNGYNTIYKFNCVTKTISELSVTLPKNLYGVCCSINGANIYIFGGELNTTIYKFNCTNETISALSATLPKRAQYACCSTYGDIIYIFGGYSGASEENTIYRFNCVTESISTLSTTLPQNLQNACCASYGDNIYIFGGSYYQGGRIYLDRIYKFNCVNETISRLSITLPQALHGACCSINGDNIYILGGYTSNGYINTIYKFNCTTHTIVTLSTILPQALYGACCANYNSNIYIFGGRASGAMNTIYNFSVSFELAANNVLIYNANSDYSFELVTNQVTIPISKIYIGDSTNTAQLANAYLYDETQTAWVNVNTGKVLTL